MRRDVFLLVSILGGLALLLVALSRFGFYPLGFIGNAIVPAELALLHAPSETRETSDSSLQAQNASLVQQLSDLRKLQQDNNALRDQFATTQIPSNTLIPAIIVGEPGLIPGVSIPAYLVLDKGTTDGISKGQIVVYKNSIVGKISEVNPEFSKVMLVADPSTTITARTQETNVLGVFKGQANGELLFDNVLLSDSLKVGDFVITNGDQSFGGKGYPPGLTLGKITLVEKNPSALFQKASIESLIDISKLRMVFVLVK